MGSCIICKVPYGVYNDVSLHKVPKSEEIRKQWVSVIGKNVTNDTKVCCDHFEDDVIYYRIDRLKKGFLSAEGKIEYQKITKHLKPGSIPRKEKYRNQHIDHTNANIQNECKDPQKKVINFQPTACKNTIKIQATVINENSVLDDQNLSNQEIIKVEEREEESFTDEANNDSIISNIDSDDTFSRKRKLVECDENSTVSSLQDKNNSGNQEISMVEDCEEESFTNEVNDDSISNMDSAENKNRKLDAAETASPFKKTRSIRYLGDFREEDFKTPELYQIFVKKLKQFNKNFRNLKDKHSRLVIKVGKLEACLELLNNKGFLSKDVLESTQKLKMNMKKKKSIHG